MIIFITQFQTPFPLHTRVSVCLSRFPLSSCAPIISSPPLCHPSWRLASAIQRMWMQRWMDDGEGTVFIGDQFSNLWRQITVNNAISVFETHKCRADGNCENGTDDWRWWWWSPSGQKTIIIIIYWRVVSVQFVGDVSRRLGSFVWRGNTTENWLRLRWRMERDRDQRPQPDESI